MIFFPNETIAQPNDVRECVKREYRKHAGGAPTLDLVDEASRDSFPASDAPPWTLGYIRHPAPLADASAKGSEIISR